jgi:hypothetical protein
VAHPSLHDLRDHVIVPTCLSNGGSRARHQQQQQLRFRVARFFLVQTHQNGKIYQMITNYTKLPKNIPNGRKIFQTELPVFSWYNIAKLEKNYQTTTNYTK